MKRDHVILALCRPSGWLCVQRFGAVRYKWEFRLGARLVAEGTTRTERGAVRAAEAAHAEWVANAA